VAALCRALHLVLGFSLTLFLALAFRFDWFVMPVLVGWNALCFIARRLIKHAWPTIDWKDVIVGGSLLAVGIVSQFVLAVYVSYCFHALWHTCVFLACFFIQDTRVVDQWFSCCAKKTTSTTLTTSVEMHTQRSP
jgi:predicted membrane channel-forming protein YqfA (hemolysin III family)